VLCVCGCTSGVNWRDLSPWPIEVVMESSAQQEVRDGPGTKGGEKTDSLPAGWLVLNERRAGFGSYAESFSVGRTTSLTLARMSSVRNGLIRYPSAPLEAILLPILASGLAVTM